MIVPHHSVFTGRMPFLPPNQQHQSMKVKQAKSTKYSNVCITKTTAAIPMKFYTMITTSKYSLWVIRKCALQIQGGGRPPFWKPSNAIYPQPIDQFWWNLACWCTLALPNRMSTKKLKFWKSHMVDSHHFENWKTAISPKLFGQFWRNLAQLCVCVGTVMHILASVFH